MRQLESRVLALLLDQAKDKRWQENPSLRAQFGVDDVQADDEVWMQLRLHLLREMGCATCLSDRKAEEVARLFEIEVWRWTGDGDVSSLWLVPRDGTPVLRITEED